jgi:myo-inositol-1(or 4)-monophosphatase
MKKIEDFFHYISPKIIEIADLKFENSGKIKYKEKNTINIVTEADFAVENLIKNEIIRRFPKDKIVAEETFTGTLQIKKGECWILDPICGSANFNNGVRFFSTNIALALNGKLIAACVVDHSKGEYIWSTGNNLLHIGKRTVKPERRSKGIVIDVDLSAILNQPDNITIRQVKLVSYLLTHKNYCLVSYATSLGFAYTALNRINAFASGHNKVWDVAAANFLVKQAGGSVTDYDGKPWTLNSDCVLASPDPDLHRLLLKIVLS